MCAKNIRRENIKNKVLSECFCLKLHAMATIPKVLIMITKRCITSGEKPSIPGKLKRKVATGPSPKTIGDVPEKYGP